MSRSIQRSKCQHSCAMCKGWKHGWPKSGHRRPDLSATGEIAVGAYEYFVGWMDDGGPEASCGDPSCGDKCSRWDDPWCDSHGDIIDANGEILDRWCAP